MEILELLKNRRSHFQKEFNGQKAPNELIEDILEAAQWAPNHKLTLPWKFYVFHEESKTKLFEAIRIAIQNTSNDPIKLEKMNQFEMPISHIIAIVLKPSTKVPEWEEIASLGAAVQNIYLALMQYPNFGGYWSTGLQTNSDELRSHLNLTTEDIHLGYFVVGGIDEPRTKSHRPRANITWC